LEKGITTQDASRRKRALIVLAACILVAIGLVAFWPREREPEYNGKKLSEWLEVYDTGKFGKRDFNEARTEATLAIDHIGVEALPWLMKWIQYERRDPPKWKVSLFILACRLHVKGTYIGTTGNGSKSYMADKSTVASLLKNQQAELANRAEYYGFKLLGARAAAAIPDLVQLTRSSNPIVSARANYALGTIPILMPQLLEMLTNQAATVRYCAVRGLNSFESLDHSFPGLDTSSFVPPLVQTLRDPDFGVREEATNALLKIAPAVLTNGINGGPASQ
jgi:hypothetical protein